MAENRLNLRQKLASIYETISHIDKYGDNKAQHYTYVRAADVLHVLRKALSAANIYAATNYALLGTYDIKTNKGGIMHAATVRAEIVFMDTETEETISVSGLGDGADSGDKGIYKAQTGATKNALRNAFLVPDEADPEADASVDAAVEEVYEEPAPAPRRAVSKPSVLAAPYGSETQVTQVPRAEIPNPDEWINNEPAAEQVEVPQNGKPEKATKAPKLELSLPATGAVPTEEELDKYRARAVELYPKLAEAGLKPSRGMSISQKVLKYLLGITSAADATKITVNQWNGFFALTDKLAASEQGLTQLVDLINKSTKGENK